MKVYTWWFDLPLYSLVPFITERLMLETDFENEAKNSETMRQLVHNEPSLRGRVYVPPVYPELSSKRVLTTEWYVQFLSHPPGCPSMSCCERAALELAPKQPRESTYN